MMTLFCVLALILWEILWVLAYITWTLEWLAKSTVNVYNLLASIIYTGFVCIRVIPTYIQAGANYIYQLIVQITTATVW